MEEIKDTGTRRKYTLGILLIVVGLGGLRYYPHNISEDT
jgi:hypothetical protein